MSSETMEQEALTDFKASAITRLEEYFAHTNQVLGITGFGFALGCAGLDLPSFFAWASMVFLALVWGDNLDYYRRYINALRSVGAPEVRWHTILLRTRIAILGWLALGCVALGFVNKHGVSFT